MLRLMRLYNLGSCEVWPDGRKWKAAHRASISRLDSSIAVIGTCPYCVEGRRCILNIGREHIPRVATMTDQFLQAAIDQAMIGLREGGIPIGTCWFTAAKSSGAGIISGFS